MTIALTRPTVDLFASWAEAVAEFGGVHIAGSGLQPPVLGEPPVLDLLIEKARSFADTSRATPEGLVHNDLYWLTDDAEVVGFVSIRHELNDFLLAVGGHVGYAVRPSRRRRGYAHAALALALERCRELGIERVLVTCDDDNVGSYRTIEAAGGVLENVVPSNEDGAPPKRRYWIEP